MDRTLWLPSGMYLLSFVVVHATLSVGVFLMCFSQSMARLDTGESAKVFEHLACGVAAVLLSPIGTLIVRWKFASTLFPGLLGYLPVLANSLLWAVAGRVLILGWRRRHKSSGSPAR